MFPTIALLCCTALSPEAGKLQPSVACQASPTHTYALYLPKAYREDRLWPVIFVFSPSGEGAETATLFQAGAERLGWIVVASNDARNGPTAPILAAQAALWKEVFDRYKTDPRRVYASGFSGGARMAMNLAELPLLAPLREDPAFKALRVPTRQEASSSREPKPQ